MTTDAAMERVPQVTLGSGAGMTATAVADTAEHFRRQAAAAMADASRYEGMGDEFWPLAMHQRGAAAAYENAAKMLDPYGAWRA